MGRRLRLLLAVAGAAVFALGVTSGPAHAASTDGTMAVEQASAADGCHFTAFGYTGSFKCDTVVWWADWDGNGTRDEYFGIAPTRTIWHAWPNSGGWKEMPNHGKADQMWKVYRNGNGQRQVEVWTATDNVWYSYYSGGWKGWYYYPGS